MERIKLAEEDFDVESLIDNVTNHELKQQILDDHEKAEKWNRVYSSLCIDNPVLRAKLYDIEQENKQLKEEILYHKQQYFHLEQTWLNLKQKLEKETIWHDEAELVIDTLNKYNNEQEQKLETSYEALQRIRDERNEAWIKLEKIKERWNLINVDLDAVEDCVKMCFFIKKEIILDLQETPEWTEKDKELYRNAKADIKSGKAILKDSQEK